MRKSYGLHEEGDIMGKIVCLAGVKKVFYSGNRAFTALANVNLEIEEGDFVSIVGPSGSGKSTLVQILSGLELPTEGSVEIAGVRLETLSRHESLEWRRDNIALVSKEGQLISSLTVLQNVILPIIFSKKFKDIDSIERGLECLEFVGFSEIANKFPSDLDEEEKRATSLARSIANGPVLLVGDEPEGNLSFQSSEKIFSILEKINQAGTTVVFVTHNTHFAIRSKRIVTLLDGNILRR